MDRGRVLAASREEVRRLAGEPLSEVTPSRRDFALYVATQKDELAVIARFARGDTERLIELACACDDAEVAALAVGTSPGELSLAEMTAIAEAVTAPILRDDLIIDPSQLYHARLRGADAAVFPAADLDGDALEELIRVASSLHMAAVVEVSAPADLEAVAFVPHVILGLRCLTASGGLDVERTQRLAEQVPRSRTTIVLPPIESPEVCATLRGVCDAVMIDAAALVGGDVRAALEAFVQR